jgi:hypothetical protein
MHEEEQPLSPYCKELQEKLILLEKQQDEEEKVCALLYYGNTLYSSPPCYDLLNSSQKEGEFADALSMLSGSEVLQHSAAHTSHITHTPHTHTERRDISAAS